MPSFATALVCIGMLAAFTAAAPGAEAPTREVFFNGAPVQAWDSARDAGRLEREYSHHSLSQAEGALRWQFSSKGPRFADIFLRWPITRPFETMVLRVRNTGAPLSLAVKLSDTGGAEYVVPAAAVATSDAWQEVRFAWSQFAVASWSKDPDGRFDWPAGSLAVIAFGVEPGKQYDLSLAEIAFLRPPAQRVRAASAGLPGVVDAGGSIEVRAEFTPEKDYRGNDGAEAQLVHGGVVVARAPMALSVPTSAWKAGQKVAAGPARLAVPRFARSGDYEVRVRVGYADVLAGGGVEGTVGRVQVRGRQGQKTVAQVRPHNGVPTLFLNGRPNAAMSYMTYRPGNGKHFGQFGQAGVHLHSFSATPTEAAYTLSRETWVAPDRWDYSQTDERSLLVLENDPDGYFFPRLYLRAPKWWTDAHPEETVTYDPGDGKPIPFLHTGGRQVPSWASEVWRRDTAEALRRYIRHMEQSPWADRVIGYHIASGTTEEWMMWGSNERQWVDYSKPNREKFRQWLRAKYGTDAALRKAWNDPSVTFATAAIPTKHQREASAAFSLHDPAATQQVIDFNLYNSDLVADTIAYFARVVKEATRNEKLVGVFYGYVLQLAGEHRQQNAGHLAIDRVLGNPDVDFITSPTSYAFRALGTGYTHFMSLVDSVRAHGKLWFDENDIRTWLTPQIGGWGWTATYEESLKAQQREFACVLAAGCGKWWFDMSSGWYDDPRMMKEIASMRAIAEASVAWDRSPAHEVALVLDPRSLAYLQTGNYLSRPLIMEQLPQLGRLGAPFGSYMLDDLEKIPPHRLYVFLSCFAPTDAQRQMIDRVVKRDGRVAVWIHAPGIFRAGKLDEEGMRALTGIRLRLAREEAALRVKTAGEDSLLAGLPAGLTYGPERPIGPVVYAEDAEAKVLGRLGTGERAGLVVRRFPTWTSVYSSAPVLPSGLLRNLARAAGVHLYTEGDEVVYGNKSILAVHVNQGGKRTIRLPRAAKVTELFSGKVMGEGVREFTADIPEKGTALFRVE